MVLIQFSHPIMELVFSIPRLKPKPEPEAARLSRWLASRPGGSSFQHATDRGFIDPVVGALAFDPEEAAWTVDRLLTLRAVHRAFTADADRLLSRYLDHHLARQLPFLPTWPILRHPHLARWIGPDAGSEGLNLAIMWRNLELVRRLAPRDPDTTVEMLARHQWGPVDGLAAMVRHQWSPVDDGLAAMVRWLADHHGLRLVRLRRRLYQRLVEEAFPDAHEYEAARLARLRAHPRPPISRDRRMSGRAVRRRARRLLARVAQGAWQKW